MSTSPPGSGAATAPSRAVWSWPLRVVKVSVVGSKRSALASVSLTVGLAPASLWMPPAMSTLPSGSGAATAPEREVASSEAPLWGSAVKVPVAGS